LKGTQVSISDVLSHRLKPKPADVPSGWTLWEHKTLNIHRGVIEWDSSGSRVRLDSLRDEVRDVVRQRFRPSWWRGFGFGVIVTLDEFDESLKEASSLIDVRNTSKGCWQWLVLNFPAARSAIGVQTWTEGYLAPTYRDVLAELESSGIQCQSLKRDMDAFLKGLMAVKNRLSLVQQVLRGVE
jgi:hypothetical protein